MGPADSIKRFTKALAQLPVDYNVRGVRDDLADLRAAFAKDDAAFASAVEATTEMLLVIVGDSTIGKDLQHRLTGWRRVRFPSRKGGHADLRTIFRANRNGSGVELRAFGHRNDPLSIYARALRGDD